MLRIDADAHVLETEKTWEYMEGDDRKFRPQIVISTDRSPHDEYWLVDGTLRLKSRNVGKNTPMESRELRDPSARLKHMDELGVDVQVIFPTMFIIPLTARPEIELRGTSAVPNRGWSSFGSRSCIVKSMRASLIAGLSRKYAAGRHAARGAWHRTGPSARCRASR